MANTLKGDVTNKHELNWNFGGYETKTATSTNDLSILGCEKERRFTFFMHDILVNCKEYIFNKACYSARFMLKSKI